MRPSAVPRIWNRYGAVDETFEEGENITIEIDSNYPIATIPGGYKALILTELGMLGGRHSGFGLVLSVTGIACFFLAFVAWATAMCCPPGSPCHQWCQNLDPGSPLDS